MLPDLPHRIVDVENLLRQSLVKNVNDASMVFAAIETCKIAHAVQTRENGQPYAIHPMRMCLILLQLEPDVSAETLCGALLHDVLEDTDYSAAKLAEDFGVAVLNIVQGCTRDFPHSIDPVERRADKQKHFEKLLQADRSVRLVKCADLLDNLVAASELRPSDKSYAKIPRWLWEAEEHGLKLAAMTIPHFVQAIQAQIDRYLALGFTKGHWGGV